MDGQVALQEWDVRNVEVAVASVEGFIVQVRAAATDAIRRIEQAVLARLGPGSTGKPADLIDIYGVAQHTLLDSVPLMYGMGFVSDPAFFGGISNTWCYTPSGPDSPRRLEVDPDFYDFATAAWWPLGHVDDDLIHTSPAYLDASGINENIITFSKRVISEGRVAGVVGADILISRLQEGLSPHLRALPPGSCVVDQSGAVIATNTAQFLGATYPSAASAEGTQRALACVPWELRIGGLR